METAQAYFLVVVQEKSLKKAAQRLFLSPQNLGNHMKRLEDRYGPLFVRRPRFTLTAVGQALAESLWEIRNIEQEFAQRAAQLSQTPQGELRMGLNSSRAQVLLPRLVPTFRQQFPEVTLDFVYGDTQVLEQQLLEGELDLVLGVDAQEQAQLEQLPLLAEPILFALAAELAEKIGAKEKRGLTPDQAASFPLLRNPESSHLQQKLTRFWARQTVQPRYDLTAADFLLQLELAAQGLGGCFFPAMLLSRLEVLNQQLPPAKQLLVYQVQDLTEKSQLSLVLRKKQFRPEFLKAWIRLWQQAAGKGA